MNGKGKEIAGAIEREVTEWPGAEVSIVEGKGHPKAKVKFGGKIMQVTFSATPSSSKSIHHTLADVRRALRRMGAERPKPEPTREEEEAEYRPKNDGASKRASPVKVEKAKPEPDISEKMVEAGVATADQQAQARATRDQSAGKPPAVKKPATVQVAEKDDEDEAEERRKREFHERVAGIVDGVYFGLPADIYHAVERASSSFLQKVDVSAATAWRGSWMDPERPDPADEEEKDWQIVGRAYHTARLEPHLFEGLYVRELDKAEAPKGTLFTGTDMGKVLEEWGLTKGGKVLEQAERLADAGHPVETLWPLRVKEWERERGTRSALKPAVYDQIISDRDAISRNPQVAPLLSGGEAEVSVFWTDEHGVKMKARIDYLTYQWWVDFKTFENSRGKKVRQAIVDAVRYNRYYMQAVVYREAVEAIRTGGLDVIEAQTDDQRELIARLRISASELTCWYVFQEKAGVPNLIAYEFPFYMVPMQNLFEGDALAGDDEARRKRSRDAFTKATQLFMKGAHDVLEAKKTFVLYSQVYGPGERWYPIDSIMRGSDEDYHPYWLSGELT